MVPAMTPSPSERCEVCKSLQSIVDTLSHLDDVHTLLAASRQREERLRAVLLEMVKDHGDFSCKPYNKARRLLSESAPMPGNTSSETRTERSVDGGSSVRLEGSTPSPGSGADPKEAGR